MKKLATSLALSVLAIGSIGGNAGWGSANAAVEPAAGTQVLDLLCAERGGTSYFSPYSIARCQEARSNKGFEIERLVCEGLIEGTFAFAPSPSLRSHTTWVCFPGPG